MVEWFHVSGGADVGNMLFVLFKDGTNGKSATLAAVWPFKDDDSMDWGLGSVTPPKQRNVMLRHIQLYVFMIDLYLFGLGSFETGSGQTGSSQKCRNFPTTTYLQRISVQYCSDSLRL